MRHYAVTAIGRDQPGIVAAVTRHLLDHEVNIEDSRMAILRGHFTMMLIVAAPSGLPEAELSKELEATRAELGLEAVSIGEVVELPGASPSPSHMVTVYGADHPGIVSGVAAALARRAINITDLQTRLVGDDTGNPLYVMLIEVAVPLELDEVALQQLLAEVGREQGLDVSVRELEADAL